MYEDSRRSSGDRARTTTLLTTATALAAGTHAYAEAVRFDNPGGFEGFNWGNNTLDITLAPGEQTGVVGAPSGITQNYFFEGYYYFSYGTTYMAGEGAAVWSSGFSNNYAAGLAAGTSIGPTLTGGEFNAFSVFEYDWCSPDECGQRGILPENELVYLGVSFQADDGVHYGWVAVERTGVWLDAYAWGYETEAGTAIQAGAVPAPGTLAALAFGAGALSRRRKRPQA